MGLVDTWLNPPTSLTIDYHTSRIAHPIHLTEETTTILTAIHSVHLRAIVSIVGTVCIGIDPIVVSALQSFGHPSISRTADVRLIVRIYQSSSVSTGQPK